MEWIDVNDRLPVYNINEDQVVIVSGVDDYLGKYVHYAHVYAYGHNGKLDDIFTIPGWSKMNVTHWMPLPNPPNG